MLTFVHLSDIHFASGDDGSQFDLNQHIRRALLRDLEQRSVTQTYDALLITGDIAYGGKTDEYEAAKKFLAELFDKTGLSMKATYVVPGNHDVDRAHVQPTFPLWASHEDIRREANSVHWRNTIQTQLQKDPSKLLLLPMHAYNDFAQGCDCRSTAEDLAWSFIFPRSLEMGYKVRLNGLNSALISDAADSPGKLLVSEFQTAKLLDAPGVVNLAMSHHPPDWLMDKAEVRQALRRFTQVALFGHEHSARLQFDDKQVQLYAGAVQPSREATGWLPTYHILQLAVEVAGGHPQLLVRVHTREFHDFKFRSWRYEDEKTILEHRLNIDHLKLESGTPLPAASILVEAADAQTAKTQEANMQALDARRELLVNFFELPTPKRYEAAYKADLLRDGDDALNPQTMWAEVFRRAESENKLAAFWNAVAEHSAAMRSKPNPF